MRYLSDTWRASYAGFLVGFTTLVVDTDFFFGRRLMAFDLAAGTYQGVPFHVGD